MNKGRDLILAFISMAFLAACSEDAERESVADEREPQTIHAIGYVEPRERLRRLAFEGQGVIAEMAVNVGDVVKEGETMTRLRSERESAEIAVAKAALDAAEAEMELLEAGAHPGDVLVAEAASRQAELESAFRNREKDRLSKLAAIRGVTGAQADEGAHFAQVTTEAATKARADRDRLMKQTRQEEIAMQRARISEAAARLTLAHSHLMTMEIKAPCAGRVVEILKHPGDAVSLAMPESVILFAPEGPLEVRAEVDESFWGQTSPGALAIMTAANGEQAEGRVRLSKGIMGKRTVFSRAATERMDLRIFEVWIDLPNAPDWPVGMEVSLEIERTGKGSP